jgi:hypothetical protein
LFYLDHSLLDTSFPEARVHQSGPIERATAHVVLCSEQHLCRSTVSLA